MNYGLLRNGFEGVIVSAVREAEYVAAVAEMYRNGDAISYVKFLAEC